MTPERWKQVEEIFKAALDLKPIERSAFLNEACGEDEILRAEVEGLLAADTTQPRIGLLNRLLSEDHHESLIGKQIRHYLVQRELGSGQVGRVYLARDTNLDRDVALKFVSSELAKNDHYLRRFKREAQTACRLKHDNIVEIYGLELEANPPYIIMQHVEGVTLRKRLEENLEIDEVLRLGIEVASALEHAHSRGVVHRDIKPENIMLPLDRGPVKVVDFGIAKITGAIPQQAEQQKYSSSGVKTIAGTLLGTLRYMSPEQAAARTPDARSDIWSLGVVLYETITRQAPFAGSTNWEIIAKIHAEDPPPLSRFREVPIGLQRCVSKALAKKKEDRYQKVSELRNDLLNLRKELGFVNEEDERQEDSNLQSRDLKGQQGILQHSGAKFGSDSAIDLAIEIHGHQAMVYMRDRSAVVVAEPSLVAIDTITNRIEALGKRAEDLLMHPVTNIQLVEPIKDARVSNASLAKALLHHLIQEAIGSDAVRRARIVMAIPLQLADFERRILVDVTYGAKAAEVYLAERPVCAAIGLGLSVKELNGAMVAHVGENDTEIIVISRGRWSSAGTISVGSSVMDRDVQGYIRRIYGVLISDNTAESIRMELGSAFPLDELTSMEIRGHDLNRRVFKTITVTDEEIREALSGAVSMIVNGIRDALERVPAQLSADIAERGVILTGGGALLGNLVKRLAVELDLPVSLAQDPISSVLTGASRLLSEFNLRVEKRTPIQEHRFIRNVSRATQSGVRQLLRLFWPSDLAIDMGTANTLVYAKGRGIIVSEPSIVALNKVTNRVEAVGRDAKDMLGRTPEDIVAIRPLRAGVIVNTSVAKIMLRHFIRKAHNAKFWISPRVVMPVFSSLTRVEREGFLDCLYAANVAEAHLVGEGIVAAIGSGLPITEPHGNMVVSVGGGTTEIAVISLSGAVYSNGIRLGGDNMTKAIIDYIRRKYNLLIGERTAEAIKIELGSAYPLDESLSYEVSGRHLGAGIPRSILLTDEEVREALEDSIAMIVLAVRNALERTPPELSADIVERGIVLTGGECLLKNLDKRLYIETGLPVSLADDPIASVILGAGRLLSDWDLIKGIEARDMIDFAPSVT